MKYNLKKKNRILIGNIQVYWNKNNFWVDQIQKIQIKQNQMIIKNQQKIFPVN